MGSASIETTVVGAFEQSMGASGTVKIGSVTIGSFASLTRTGYVYVDSFQIGVYKALYKTNEKMFKLFLDTVRSGFHGDSSFLEVTRKTLMLGEPDSVTGWYVKDYDDSTIKMVIIQKEAQQQALQLGYWVSLDALGFTLTQVEIYDLITDKLGRTWEIKTVKPIIVGDSVHFFVCDLKELPLHA